MTMRRSSSGTCDEPIEARIERVLEQVRPALRSDGGDIEFVDVDATGRVRVKLHGACVGCPSSLITLSMDIERNLREQVAGVTSVVCV